MEGHWACAQGKKGGGISSSSSFFSFTTPFSFHSPPSPNPLAAGRTAEGQRERRGGERRREEDTERQEGEKTGVGCLDVHEHAERRVRGRAMTAMLSPKIRQTRRGRTQFVCLHIYSCCLSMHYSVVAHLTGTMMEFQIR